MKLRKDDREYLSKTAQGIGQAAVIGAAGSFYAQVWGLAAWLTPIALVALAAGLLLNRKEA